MADGLLAGIRGVVDVGSVKENDVAVGVTHSRLASIRLASLSDNLAELSRSNGGKSKNNDSSELHFDGGWWGENISSV